MRWSRRLRSSYANVVSTLALCIALGGTSYAAVAITGKDVKNGSLTGKDLKKGSLTTTQVKNRSLLAADFKLGELPAAGETGPQGPSGAQGAQGPPGPRGPAGYSPELFENEESSAVDASQSKVVDVLCPQGTLASEADTPSIKNFSRRTCRSWWTAARACGRWVALGRAGR